MTERDNDLAGFLHRWSRRKLGANTPEAGNPPANQAPTGPVRQGEDRDEKVDQLLERFANFDFDSLDFASDYTRFMARDIPEDIQRKALQRLWPSNESIARPDDLDDYLEDFSEAAMALPAELAKSSYRIGCGFITDDERAPVIGSQGVTQAQPRSSVTSPPEVTSNQKQRAPTDHGEALVAGAAEHGAPRGMDASGEHEDPNKQTERKDT